MRHSVVGVLGLSYLYPVVGFAQESGKFAYCQVEDTGGSNIWVSQIFPRRRTPDY